MLHGPLIMTYFIPKSSLILFKEHGVETSTSPHCAQSGEMNSLVLHFHG